MQYDFQDAIDRGPCHLLAPIWPEGREGTWLLWGKRAENLRMQPIVFPQSPPPCYIHNLPWHPILADINREGFWLVVPSQEDGNYHFYSWPTAYRQMM